MTFVDDFIPFAGTVSRQFWSTGCTPIKYVTQVKVVDERVDMSSERRYLRQSSTDATTIEPVSNSRDATNFKLHH